MINPTDIRPFSLWKYKRVLYGVLSLSEDELIQYDDQWLPTIKYSTAAPTHLRFIRSQREFREKFEWITDGDGPNPLMIL